LKNAYAQEIEKSENLTKELSICHDSISNLRTENASLISKVEKLNVCNDSISSLRNGNASLVSKIKELNVCNDSITCLRDENERLNAKIEELNVCKPSTSTVDHVSICTRCRDVNIEAINDHLAMIKQQNDHIAKLTAKINEHEIENEKFKFARSMLYNGRRPGIKDGIGFQQGSNVKLNAPKRLSEFVKGKAPMVQDNEGYILYPANYPKHKIRKIHARKPHTVSHQAFIYKNEASSSRHSTHIKMPKKKIPAASNEHNISFKTFDASYVLTNKSGKIVAKYVGSKHKSPKTCDATADGADIAIDTFYINSVSAAILLDSGATHSFIYARYVNANELPLQTMQKPMIVITPKGPIEANFMTNRLTLTIMGSEFWSMPIVLEESSIDLILGMPWLRKAKAVIHYAEGTVELNSPKGERFEVMIEREMCPWAISKYFGD
jgi:predicted aspartyl protease